MRNRKKTQQEHVRGVTLQLWHNGFKLALITTKQALKTISLKARF